MVWFILAVLVLLLVGSLVKQSQQNARVKRAAQEAGASDGVMCQHVEGLGLVQGTPCEVWSFPDRLQIRAEGRTFNLSLAKLRAIEAKSEAEIREVQRSVVGRAIVGNLLVPGLGAVVGGMSGLNTKKKGPTHHYLIVNYVDDHGELQGITFMGDGNIFRFQQFANGVKQQMAVAAPQAIDL